MILSSLVWSLLFFSFSWRYFLLAFIQCLFFFRFYLRCLLGKVVEKQRRQVDVVVVCCFALFTSREILVCGFCFHHIFHSDLFA